MSFSSNGLANTTGNNPLEAEVTQTPQQIAARKKLAPKSKGQVVKSSSVSGQVVQSSSVPGQVVKSTSAPEQGIKLPSAPKTPSSIPAPPQSAPFAITSEAFNFDVGLRPSSGNPPAFVGSPDGPPTGFDDPTLFDPRVKLQDRLPSLTFKTVFEDPTFFDPRVKDLEAAQKEGEEKKKKQRKKSRNQERKEARQRRKVMLTDDHKLWIQECLDQLAEDDEPEVELSKALEIVKSEMEGTEGLDSSEPYDMVGLDVLPKGKLDALLDHLASSLGIRVPTNFVVVPAEQPEGAKREEEGESEEEGEGADPSILHNDPDSSGLEELLSAEFDRLKAEEAEAKAKKSAQAASIDPDLTSPASAARNSTEAEPSAGLPTSAAFPASVEPVPNPHPTATTVEMVSGPSIPALPSGWLGSEGESQQDSERQDLRDEITRLTIDLQEVLMEKDSIQAASEQAIEHARASAQSELGEAKAMLDHRFRQELQQATDRLAADFLARGKVLEEEHRQRCDHDAAVLRQAYEADLSRYQAEIVNLRKSASAAEAQKAAFANELANLKSKISEQEKDKKARFAGYEAELNHRAKREQDLLDRLGAAERQLQTAAAEKEELARTSTKGRADLNLETEKRRAAEAALGRDQDRIDHLETSLQASRAELQDARAMLQERERELDGLVAQSWKVEEERRDALAENKALKDGVTTMEAKFKAELAARDDKIEQLHAQLMQASSPPAAEIPAPQKPEAERPHPSAAKKAWNHDGPHFPFDRYLDEFDREFESFNASPRTFHQQVRFRQQFWHDKKTLWRTAQESGSLALEAKSASTKDEDAGPLRSTPLSPPSKVSATAVEEVDAGQGKEGREPVGGRAASAADISEETAAPAAEPNAGRVRLTPHQTTGRERMEASDTTVKSPSAGGLQEAEAVGERADRPRGPVAAVQASGATPSASDVELDDGSPHEERWVDASPNLPGSWPEGVVCTETTWTTSVAGLAGVGPDPARLMDGAMGMLQRYPFALVILILLLLSVSVGLSTWWELLEERNRWVAANTVPPSFGSLFAPNPAPSIFWQWTWGYKPRWASILHYRIVEYLNGNAWWPIPEPEWLP